MTTSSSQAIVRAAALPAMALFLISAASSVSGCQTEVDRNLGQTLEGRTLPVTNAGAAEHFGEEVGDFAGNWIGTVEDPLALGGQRPTYVFPSGVTQIRLHLAPTEVEGPPRVEGNLVFGGGSPPPLPSDASDGYPAEVDYTALGYFNAFSNGPAGYVGPLPPYEGFAYQVSDALYSSEISGNEVADGILRLGYDTQELLAPWCEMQEPRSNGNGGFDCAGGANYYFEEGQCSIEGNNLGDLISSLSDEQIQNLSAEDWAALEAQIVRQNTPVDCDKLFLCVTQRCVCDDQSCRADVSGFTGVAGSRPRSASYAELTLRRTPDGSGLIGVFSNAVFQNERQLSVPVGVAHFERAN